MINEQTACHVIEMAAETIQSSPGTFRGILDALPTPIYLADPQGTLTYFNEACVDFAGRTPLPGTDKWCVTWKLYTLGGEYLPHDRCPMAVALREARPVRDVEAIAERPDGTFVNFVPYPTPLFDDEGNLSGAVNLLLDVTQQRTPDYLNAQAGRCRRLAKAMTDARLAETLLTLAEKYEGHARRFRH